jgi:hypothetical protein
MAENEEDYLRQCLERNICPVCQQPITQGRCILYFELLHRMEQGIADTTTSRQSEKE